jgi:hypothetical protein
MTRIRSLAAAVAAVIAVAGCTPDKITELENGENGTKVETQDDREWYFRHGIDCDEGDRLWECASRSDLLVDPRGERGGSRG